MIEEISAAVLFLTRLIEKGENFNHDQLEHFKLNLSEVLAERFENHWFPDKPYKGQGYRCIRVNGVNRRDPTLVKAARASGIKYEDMKLPCELTIWVDPNEVCCRFGEHKGSFCTLASFNDKDTSGSSSGSEDSQGEDAVRMKHSQTSPVTNEESLSAKSLTRSNKNGSNKGRKSCLTQRVVGNVSLRRGGFQQQGQVGQQVGGWYGGPPWLSGSAQPAQLATLRAAAAAAAAAVAAAHHRGVPHAHPNAPHHPHHHQPAKWGRYHWPSTKSTTLKV